MRTTRSYSVDFIVRRNKKNKSIGLLYARITLDRETKELSLQETIELKDWDSRKEVVNKKGIEAQTVNDLIIDTRIRLKEIYRHFLGEEIEFSAQNIKDRYFGKKEQKKKHSLLDLTAFFKKIYESKMKAGGFKNYRTTADYISLFLKTSTETGDINLDDINKETLTNFEHYVRNTPIKENDPCLGNGVGKHIQRFKRIMNWAFEIQWLAVNPVETYRCTIKKNKRKKLTMQQVLMLENKVFSNPVVNYAKDLFIFSCYTSFAYIDVVTLTEEDFEFQPDGKIWCKKYRVKSQELQRVLLLKSAAAILHKYRDTTAERKTIFPYVSNQSVNRSLHIIEEACEFAIPLTFHIARHTFAKTVALKNGVSMETLQMIMGHTKITTTQIYADVDEEIISTQMEALEKKLEHKREEMRQPKLVAI